MRYYADEAGVYVHVDDLIEVIENASNKSRNRAVKKAVDAIIEALHYFRRGVQKEVSR
jgi:hypothetical protein